MKIAMKLNRLSKISVRLSILCDVEYESLIKLKYEKLLYCLVHYWLVGDAEQRRTVMEYSLRGIRVMHSGFRSFLPRSIFLESDGGQLLQLLIIPLSNCEVHFPLVLIFYSFTG